MIGQLLPNKNKRHCSYSELGGADPAELNAALASFLHLSGVVQLTRASKQAAFLLSCIRVYAHIDRALHQSSWSAGSELSRKNNAGLDRHDELEEWRSALMPRWIKE